MVKKHPRDRVPVTLRAKRLCAHCGEVSWHDYMVRNEVWACTGLGPNGGVLHLPCLESLLGRRLVLRDFSDAPCNDEIFFAARMNQ